MILISGPTSSKYGLVLAFKIQSVQLLQKIRREELGFKKKSVRETQIPVVTL